MLTTVTSALFPFLCAGFLISSMPGQCAVSGPLPVIRAGHPRLLITADDLQRLKRQAAAYPAEWKRVESAALAAPSDAGYSDSRALVNAALAYFVTRQARTLASAVALSGNICRHHRFDTYASPEALFALAIAYDWCYPELDQTVRHEIQQEILRIAAYLRDSIWRHSDFNNHFVLEKVWPFVYAGLALHDDVADPDVDRFLSTGSDLLHQHLLPAANAMAGNSGGQAEGYGYDSWGYMRPMAWTFEAWRTATGEDLFKRCTAAKYNALWNIYGRRPFDHRLEHLDDADLDHAWSGGDEGAFIYLLARRGQDGRAQWMGDQIPRRYDSTLWPIILWRDPALLPRPPGDLPTARLFDGLGWVLMRSSWDDDATFATFQCGPFLTGHQHLDNNSFTIQKRSLLAIDSGVNAYGENVKTDYRTNYYSRTIAHNSILVYDPHETFAGGPWAGEKTGGANDGGQLRSGGLERVGDLNKPGRQSEGAILAYHHDPLCTYAVGDTTRSYSPHKLRLFLRHFLFLPPNLFIVFDQVQANDAAFRKMWLLHSVEEPAVHGGVTTIRSGPGRLTCRTLLPENPSIITVGGPGKECWVDGRNWPPVEKPWTPDAGAWRTEISPSRPAKQDLFLNLLETDGTEIASPGAASVIRKPGRVGVRVQAQGRTYEVLFGIGKASAHVRIQQHGRLVLDRALP